MSRLGITIQHANERHLMIGDDYHTFRWLALRLCDHVSFGKFGGNSLEAIRQVNDVYGVVLYFLYGDIARLSSALFKTKLSRHLSQYENISVEKLSEGDQLEITRSMLLFHNAPGLLANHHPFQSNFFDTKIGEKIETLLSASLNADLNKVKEILANNPLQVSFLLSKKAKGRATYAHLQTNDINILIERTGTPLQMAIFGDDEGMQEFFKEHMDFDEYKRQAIEVFETGLQPDILARLKSDKAPALSYQKAMGEQQQKDAEKLCARIEALMRASKPEQFSCPFPTNTIPRWVASTTCAEINAAVEDFQTGLLHYHQINLAHNPYIIQKLFGIYKHGTLAQDCFFSQKVFGSAGQLISPRWLQHFAQGLNDISENNEPLRRSFICLHSSSTFNRNPDIRQFAPLLGVDHFLDSIGSGCWGARLGDDGDWYQKLRQGKTECSRNLLRQNRVRLIHNFKNVENMYF